MKNITVDWAISNGAETKIVKHPAGDIWNEKNACSELTKILSLQNQELTELDVIINEIAWFDKYSEENISVYDKWVGYSLPIKGYIDHLRHCAKEIESYT